MQRISPTTLGLIGALLVAGGVLGFSAYIQIVVLPVPVPVVPQTSYPTDVLKNDLKPGGVFTETSRLVRPKDDFAANGATYLPSDLGKADLSASY